MIAGKIRTRAIRLCHPNHQESEAALDENKAKS
jgi:hypothetical protein